jgi:hypothetical protein
MSTLKAWAIFSFFGLWVLLFEILPYEYMGADTRLGDDIQQAIKALGATIVIWSPIFGTLYAVQWFRRTRT